MTFGAVVVILAAGAGKRLGRDEPKGFITLGGRPLFAHSLGAASECPDVDALVLAVPPNLEPRATTVGTAKPVTVVAGGETRQGSVLAALAAVPEEVLSIVIHDAARPFVTPGLFSVVLGALAGSDAAGVIPVIPVPDTVKRVREGLVAGTEDRGHLSLAQTPQAFRAAELRDAHSRAAAAARVFTDDASVMEWAGYRVRTVPGDPTNFKITTAEDLALAELVAGEWTRA